MSGPTGDNENGGGRETFTDPTERRERLLDRVGVILVEPLYGGNIGSVARAMKNMGIMQLTMVKPRQFPTDECRWMARDAQDVLDEARVCGSLAEAAAPYTITVAASRRIGRFRRPDFAPRQMARVLVPLLQDNGVALVFGREDDGLTRQEVAMCQYVVSIPTSELMRSLNLAQAVLLCCYELFLATFESPDVQVRRLARVENLERLYDHMEDALTRIGYMVSDNPDHVMTSLRRIFSRAALDERDVRILRGVFRGIDNYMNVLRKRAREEG